MKHVIRRPSTWIFASLAAAGALLLGPLGPRSARASIIMAFDLPEMVRRSDHIAVVDVMTSHAAWDAKHERIFSTVDMKVVERWKGTPPADGQPDHVTVVQPGGTVDDMTMTVTGLGTFKAGERALVFLQGDVKHAQLVGMTQGKRAVRRDATTGRWMVHPPNLFQATLVKVPSSSSTQAPAPVRASDLHPSGLDDLRAEVKGLIGATTP